MNGWLVLPTLVLTFLLTPDLTRPAHALTADKAVDLVNFLFDENFYSKRVRPVASYNETLPLLMQFELLSLTELDPVAQTLTTLGRLHFYWVDHLLTWNATDQGGIPEMLVKQGDIWLPDIVVTNTAGEPVTPGHKELPIYLQQCGSIYWNPIIQVTTHCDVSIDYFPFDYQRCHIELGTEMSLAFEVEVFIHSTINEYWEPLSLYNYPGHDDWDIVETAADSLRNDADPQDKIRFSFLLQRKNIGYVLTLAGPLLLLALASCLVFVMPTESGEKATTGLLVLLAFVVYLCMWSSLLPDSGTRVSVLTVYLLILLLLVVLVVVVNGFTLRVHHRPVWLRVTPGLTRFTRKVNGRSRKLDHVMSVASFKDLALAVPTPDYPYPSISPHKPRKNIASTPQQLNASSGYMIGGAAFASSVNGSVQPLDLEDLEDQEPEVQETKTKVKGTKTKKAEADLPPVTWPEVSKAMDRVCLVLFIALMLIVTVIFALVIVGGGETDKPGLTQDTVSADVDFSRYYNQLCCGYDCIATNGTSYGYRRK